MEGFCKNPLWLQSCFLAAGRVVMLRNIRENCDWLVIYMIYTPSMNATKQVHDWLIFPLIPGLLITHFMVTDFSGGVIILFLFQKCARRLRLQQCDDMTQEFGDNLAPITMNTVAIPGWDYETNQWTIHVSTCFIQIYENLSCILNTTLIFDSFHRS